MTIIVCVGSSNPVKVNATKKAFSRFFDDLEVLNMKVPSGVSDQPIGLKNIIKGAINRASNALRWTIKEKEIEQVYYGIGIEAGLVKIPKTLSGYMDYQYAAIKDVNGKVTLGSGIGFEYPIKVIDAIINDRSREIGEIMGEISGNLNLKQEEGAIGFLSSNEITREDILSQAVICALIPRLNDHLYR